MPSRRLSKLETSAAVAQIIESIVAALAFLLAGWWFLEQRQNYPRAVVTQSIDVISVEPGILAVEANVRLENAGKKLLKLRRARIRLQEVSGKPFEYADLARLEGDEYWKAVRPLDTPNRRQFHAGELRWPVLKIFDDQIDYRIEAGETDNLVFTFLVPCVRKIGSETRSLGTLRVATDIFKPDSEEGKEFAWKARAFADVSKECAK